MSVLLLVDPRLISDSGASLVAADPAAKWGATTVRSAAIVNAAASATVRGGRHLVVVADSTDHAAIVAEVERFCRIGKRPIPNMTLVASLDDPDLASAVHVSAQHVAAGDAAGRLIGWLDQPTAQPALWDRLAATTESVVVAGRRDQRAPFAVPLDTADEPSALASMLSPLDVAARAAAHRVTLIELDLWDGLQRSEAGDASYVEECLGRTPQVAYSIAARRPDGRPTVIENPPFMADGRPMPTTFWLIDPELNKRIGTIEAGGGVDAAEADLGLELLAATHDRYRAYRDTLIPDDHEGYRPSGGVGGTRVGVKCLHTHYAWYLAGGDDPVGEWTQQRLNDSE